MKSGEELDKMYRELIDKLPAGIVSLGINLRGGDVISQNIIFCKETGRCVCMYDIDNDLYSPRLVYHQTYKVDGIIVSVGCYTTYYDILNAVNETNKRHNEVARINIATLNGTNTIEVTFKTKTFEVHSEGDGTKR